MKKRLYKCVVPNGTPNGSVKYYLKKAYYRYVTKNVYIKIKINIIITVYKFPDLVRAS